LRSMKAWSFSEYGPPSVLAMANMMVPEATPGNVQLRVHVAAVNPSDVKNVAGAFHATLPRVPGRDYVGTVVAGSDAWRGKQVWGSGPGFGVMRDGTHAEYVLVPIEGLSEKPSSLSPIEAATVGVPYLAAWRSLVDVGGIQAGETILITGVSGAVGRAATQIAHLRGAKVIGADIKEGQSGADHMILTPGRHLSAEVKSLTKGVGVDMVLDAVGGPMFEPALDSLRRGGRQVAITSVGARRVEFDLVDFLHGEKHLTGVDTTKLTAAEIARIMDALREGFDEGHLKPSPTTSWPFSKAVEAYGAVASGTSSTTHVLLTEES
jgi:NADPH:quinone reductase